MSSIYDWSLVAPENARADDIINWAEGQLPSTVNDSARAMMQRIREYLADNGGDITAKLTINHNENHTLINLSTKSDFSMYTNGIVIRFKSPAVNVGATFVMLNQLQSQPIYKITYDGVKPLYGGEIQEKGIYELVYYFDIAGKNLDGWCLTNPTPPIVQDFPPGCITAFAMRNIPKGWLMCDGQEYGRKEYARLFLAIGEIWGKGDSRNTFNVPDLRGMFLCGLDCGKKIDGSRVLRSRKEGSFKAHTHEGKVDLSGEYQHEVDRVDDVDVCTSKTRCIKHGKKSAKVHETVAEKSKNKLHLDKIRGKKEVHPVNMAVTYAIKT
ncbi:phage tail protein [Bartonella sp. B35(2025)]